MATSEDFRKLDIGNTYTITCKVGTSILDISSAILKKIIFKTKTGKIKIFDTYFTTNGTDGKMEYRFIAGDLDEEGEWKVQGFVRFSASEQYYTEIENFKVGTILSEII